MIQSQLFDKFKIHLPEQCTKWLKMQVKPGWTWFSHCDHFTYLVSAVTIVPNLRVLKSMVCFQKINQNTMLILLQTKKYIPTTLFLFNLNSTCTFQSFESVTVAFFFLSFLVVEKVNEPVTKTVKNKIWKRRRFLSIFINIGGLW